MPTEVHNVLQYIGDTAGLIARLLYGSGMRLQEYLRLRVKDIDFDNHRIIVRSAKGAIEGFLASLRFEHRSKLDQLGD